MLRIHDAGYRLCDGLTRREWLRVGALGAFGLSAASLSRAASPGRRAKSCIVLFLTGGPPQHSTWDPKPDALADVRGDFAPIATRVPGVVVSELLPRMAQVADRLCILRAVSTGDNAHASSGY